VRVSRRRVGIRVRLDSIDKLAIVDPENLIADDGSDEPVVELNHPA
jgi:hypothetical protein